MRIPFLLIVFLCFQNTFGKERIYNLIEASFFTQKQETYQDSLKHKTFKDLQKEFDRLPRTNGLIFRDSIKAKNIAQVYLSRAKERMDTLEMANGYRLFVKTYPYNYIVGLRYCDSIIKITENGNFKQYPAKAYLYQGIIHNEMQDSDKAISSYLQALKQFKIEKDTLYIIALQNNIAIIKDELGRHEEALKTYQKNYQYILTQDTIGEYSSFYPATLCKLTHSYNRKKAYDSAHYYAKKGISFCNSQKIQHFYVDLLVGFGHTSYLKQDYQTALDTLQKALKLSDKNVGSRNEKNAHYYISKTLLKLNRSNEAIKQLKYLDSITNPSDHNGYIRDVYPLLIEYYKSTRNLTGQLKIMDKLIKLDSTRYSGRIRLINEFNETYTTPKLIKNRNQLIQEIEDQNNKKSYSKFILFSFLILSLIASIFFFYYRKKKLADRLSFIENIQNLKNEIQKKSIKTKELEIPTDVTKEVLKKLDNFEKNKDFLKNNITLAKVAKKLKTNSTYLSKIINTHKSKNFANYLNDLRIEFCVVRLKTDTKFRSYSIESIAKEVGFNSIQSFSSTFHKKTGIYPSHFIKELEK